MEHQPADTVRIQEADESTDSAVVRRLGFTEARMHLLHELFHGTTQGAAAVAVRATLTAERVRSAVERLARRYEILQLNFTRIGDDFYFRRNPEQAAVAVPLEVRRREDAAQWIDVVERENSCPLSARAPWRVIVLLGPENVPAHHDLIILCHHAIMDGAAFAPFIDYLLTQLSCDLQVESGQCLPLSPPAEELFPYGSTWQEYQARQERAAKARPPIAPLAHRRALAASERTTRVLAQTLDENVGSSRVDLQACKLEYSIVSPK